MIGFVLRRFVNYLLLSAFATALGYVLASLTLDPAARFLGKNPPVPQATIDHTLQQLGVSPSVPVLTRLWDWSLHLLTTGSLGLSTRGTEVTSDIVARAGTSLRLLAVGTLLGALLGVAVGVWGAVRQYRLVDRVTGYGSFVVLATPTFVVAVLLMIAATGFNDAVGTQVISFTGEYTAGITGTWAVLQDRLVHLLLPTITLTVFAVASYSRYQRSAMLDVLSADFIRTARAKGRRRASALVQHGVRVALIPMSTFFAYSFGLILTGASVTEVVFSWNGMGQYLLDSISNNDVNAAAGTILFTSVLVLISGTLADVLYAALDPRVRI